MVATYTTVASMWVVTFSDCFLTLTRPYPVTLLPIGSGYFLRKHSPYNTPHFSN